ncbi:MAG: PQQ-like beta-propeller repeat protein [Planctomycetales bacterium]|nr:PQQ-like beta-propeller repeat protein [Planctomycetales bacterium]
MNIKIILVVTLLLCPGTLFGQLSKEIRENWHQWRGPMACGLGVARKPPLEWSESKNIVWKVAIDGQGTSTPIIWNEKLFLLTTIDTGKADPNLPPPDQQPERPFGITFPNTIHNYVIICLNRNTGEEIWCKTAVSKIPHQGHHGDNDFASSSPTTDGERLFVWFGSAGLFCYDLNGEKLWDRDLGEVETRLSFGEGSSPVVHENRLVLVRDHEGQSVITVFDTKTGDTVWEKERDEPSAWSTPVIATRLGTTQVVTNGKNRIRSYDLVDGRLIWECGGQVSNVTPSPIAVGNVALCTSGYRGSALQAIALDSQGDVTDSEKVLWSRSNGTPYVPSPLLYCGHLYFNQSNQGILSCVHALNGQEVFGRTRLPSISQIYSSPVGGGGRVYVTGRDGTTLVLKRGPEFEVLATNKLDDEINASAALVGHQLFLRGKKFTYCIAEQQSVSTP